jgi:cytochrome c-type biogenesis protein
MSIADTASSGPLILAIGASALAGLVSFLSPCVLPLVPGYLSYVTGLAGADLDQAIGREKSTAPPVLAAASAGGVAVAEAPPAPAPTKTLSAVRGRIVAGTLLFIAGFATIFILSSVIAAHIGRQMLLHERAVEFWIGLVVVILGVAFLGFIPGMQREFRIHRLPNAGLAGAPVLGLVFGLSWAPCVSPTLGAVLALSWTGGQSGRAAVLAAAYCLGLGLPFLAFGLGFRRLIGVFSAVRRHSQWVTRIGGALLIIIGIALMTGAWGDFANWLRATVGTGTVGI